MANKSTKKTTMVIDSTNNTELLETTLPTSPEVLATFSSAIHEQPEYITFDKLKEGLANGKKIHEILTFRKYLSIIEKQLLIEEIARSSTIFDNGIKKIDYISLDMYFAIYMVEKYTDYSFLPETMIEEYDYIIKNEILGKIYQCMNGVEIDYIENMIHKVLKQDIAVDNSMESVLNNHMWILQDKLEELFAKLPNIDESFVNKALSKFGKIVGKFNPESVSQISELSKFVGGKSK